MAFARQARAQDPRVEAAVTKIDAVIARGPYQASWDSLVKYQVPEWYRDAKFGIFIHWGVYSVPAFDSEWYSRNMYIMGGPVFKHHLETYGPQNKFGYKDFIPMFRRDFRFTTKGDSLYAIALAWPESGRLAIKSLASGSTLSQQKIRKVELLDYQDKLKWKQTSGGLFVKLPPEKHGDYALAIKIAPMDRAP
ncbi:MAG TPA: alpha-L-fucosidase [Terriglobia bacterium]|nr:alpha-L-fucosidase [Terriglobia bacterium]